MRSDGPIVDGLNGFRLNSCPRETAFLFANGVPVEAALGRARFADVALDVEFGNRFVREGEGFVLFEGGVPHLVTLAARGTGHLHAHDGDILSPMPGKIIAVEVVQGQAVTKGQKLLTLEAMKMEHTLTAPFDGVVAELSAVAGAQVQVEAVLARIEANAETA